MISYNETAITNIDGIMPCITSLNNIGESIESICAHEELAKEIDQIVFYKKDEGSFFKLVIKDERQPEVKFSSLIESPNKIKRLSQTQLPKKSNSKKFSSSFLI